MRSKQRVAIYAYIGEKPEKELGNKLAKLTRMIWNHDNWELVEIYADIDKNEAKQLERLLDEYEKLCIKVVMINDIQSFGKNPEEILNNMRTLVGSNVQLYFLPCSRSKDEKNPLGYGYEYGEGHLITINQWQAKVVQQMYRSYLNGTSITGIRKELFEQHIPSPTGKERWPMRTIDLFLSEEVFMKEIVQWRTVEVGWGFGLTPKISIASMLDSIIDKDTFDAVQAEKKSRSPYTIDENGDRRRTKKYSSKKR